MLNAADVRVGSSASLLTRTSVIPPLWRNVRGGRCSGPNRGCGCPDRAPAAGPPDCGWAVFSPAIGGRRELVCQNARNRQGFCELETDQGFRERLRRRADNHLAFRQAKAHVARQYWRDFDLQFQRLVPGFRERGPKCFHTELFQGKPPSFRNCMWLYDPGLKHPGRRRRASCTVASGGPGARFCAQH